MAHLLSPRLLDLFKLVKSMGKKKIPRFTKICASFFKKLHSREFSLAHLSSSSQTDLSLCLFRKRVRAWEGGGPSTQVGTWWST